MSAQAAALQPRADDNPTDEPAAAERFIAIGDSETARRNRRITVATYMRTFTDLTGWATATPAQRLCAPLPVRGLVAFLLLATAYPTDAGYVRSCRSGWGHHAKLTFPDFAATFEHTAHTLGFTTAEARRQWGVLAKILATTGTSPETLDPAGFRAGADALTAAHTRPDGRIPVSWSTPLHGLKATLAALGLLADAPPTRLSPSSRSAHWDELAARTPQLVATLRRYLTQVAVSMRPGSVALIDTTLRHLAVYLTDHHPDIGAVAGIRRTHIEGFKTFLASRVGYRSNPGPAKTTIGMRLGHLRSFFDRIIEWDYTDTPTRNPVFAGALPPRDEPLARLERAVADLLAGVPADEDRRTLTAYATCECFTAPVDVPKPGRPQPPLPGAPRWSCEPRSVFWNGCAPTTSDSIRSPKPTSTSGY